MPLRQDFGSFRRPVDAVSPLQQAFSNVQSMFANMQNQETKQKQFQEELLLRQAAEERAKQAADLRMKEYNRAIEQDKALKNALLGVSGDITGTTKVIPGTTTTKDVAGTLTQGESQGIEQGRKNLEDILLNLQTEQARAQAGLEGSPVGPGEFTGELSPNGIPLRAGESAVDKPYTPPGGFLDKATNIAKAGIRGSGVDPLAQPLYEALGMTETADTTLPMKSSKEGTKKEAGSVLPLTDRIAQAQKDLELYNQQATQAGTDIAKDRATTTTVTTPEKVEIGKLTRSEWEDREKEKLRGLNLSGKGLSDALTVIRKKGDQLFGSSAPLKLSDQLRLLEYQQKRKDKQLTRQDYEGLYPSQKGKINTVEGWKAYEKKLGDKASKKFNIAEDLYKNMTGKDSGDVNAIFNFLTANNTKLGNMSSDELRTLASQLKAKYANESGVLDLTDYLGGSAAGDVFQGVVLK